MWPQSYGPGRPHPNRITSRLPGRARRFARARFSEERSHEVEHPPLLESMRETVRYAKKSPRVLALLSVKGGYGTGAGTIAMLSVYGKEVFNAGAMGIGLLFTARGIGALLGPFVIRWQR